MLSSFDKAGFKPFFGFDIEAVIEVKKLVTIIIVPISTSSVKCGMINLTVVCYTAWLEGAFFSFTETITKSRSEVLTKNQ